MDVAAAASVVLALAVIVDMALALALAVAVAAVLAMAIDSTKVCFLFDCSVLFSTFLTLLFPLYPTPMQQQRKLHIGRCFAAVARTRRSFFRFVTAGMGIGAVVTAVAAAMIVVVVAVIVVVAMTVVAAVAKAEDIAYVA